MRFVTDLSRGILGKPDSRELWEEIVSHIPDEVFLKPDVKILCVAAGHGTEADVIVARMRRLGCSINDIKNSIYLLDKYSVFVNEAIRKGYVHVIKADFLDWTSNMKFDLILANPPYNDEHNSGNALWSQFVMKTDSMLSEKGYSAYIVPGRWVLPGVNINKGKIRIWDEIISKKNTISINHGKCSDYFPNIGSDLDYFSYFIYSNEPNKGITQLSNRLGNFTINTSKLKWLPYKNANYLSISIVSKINSKTTDIFDLSWKYEQRKKKLTDNGIYPIFTGRDSDLNPIIKYSDEMCSMQNNPKIIFKLGRFMNYDRRIYIDYTGEIGFNSAYVITINKDENYDYLQSKIYRFLGMCLFNGSEITADGYRVLPKLPNRKRWSDSDLYNYFNLTQEEIDYIESNIK